MIIGSSFIGMEAAAMLYKHASVTVVGMEKVPFERVLGEQIGKAFQTLHESNGITFQMQSSLSHYVPAGELHTWISNIWGLIVDF